eukprot:s902_g25.t1
MGMGFGAPALQAGSPSVFAQHAHQQPTVRGMSRQALDSIIEQVGGTVSPKLIHNFAKLVPDDASGKLLSEAIMNYLSQAISRADLVRYYGVLLESSMAGCSAADTMSLKAQFIDALNRLENGVRSHSTAGASSGSRSHHGSNVAGLETQFGFGMTGDTGGPMHGQHHTRGFSQNVMVGGCGSAASFHPHVKPTAQLPTFMFGAPAPSIAFDAAGCSGIPQNENAAAMAGGFGGQSMLGLGHPGRSPVPQSSAQAASMTPFGLGQIATSSAISIATGALQESMAGFVAERAQTRLDAEKALESIALTGNMSSDYSIPKTYGETNAMRADAASDGGSEASALEGLVHYSNIAPLMRLLDAVPKSYQVGTSFGAKELAQIPTNLHFSSQFAQALCAFSEDAINVIMKLQATVAAETNPVRKVSYIQALRSFAVEYHEDLTTAIWDVQSAGHSAERSGMPLRHMLFLVQPPRASERRGKPSWMNIEIMTQVFNTLYKAGVFLPLSDEQVSMLEQALPAEYISYQMKAASGGINRTGQDMSSLTILLMAAGPARGDLLDILANSGPSVAHSIGGFHRGLKVVTDLDALKERYMKHLGMDIAGIDSRIYLNEIDISVLAGNLKSLFMTAAMKRERAAVDMEHSARTVACQICAALEEVNEAARMIWEAGDYESAANGRPIDPKTLKCSEDDARAARINYINAYKKLTALLASCRSLEWNLGLSDEDKALAKESYAVKSGATTGPFEAAQGCNGIGAMA